MTNSPVAPGDLPLSTLKPQEMQKRPRSGLMAWSWMDAGFEWISPLLNDPTLRLLGSTWDAPHTMRAPAHHHRHRHQGGFQGMTGVMTGAIMTVAMIATMTENITAHTDADLLLLTTETGPTGLDHDLAPTHHVTTEQRERRVHRSSIFFSLFVFSFFKLFMCEFRFCPSKRWNNILAMTKCHDLGSEDTIHNSSQCMK